MPLATLFANGLYKERHVLRERHCMAQPSRRLTPNTSNVLAVIMGGGPGPGSIRSRATGPSPPCRWRASIAWSISRSPNCINSGMRRIYLLTQFNSTSLHRHISQSYKFDQFATGFVEILAAQMTLTDSTWYPGNRRRRPQKPDALLESRFRVYRHLSGDQLYRMDLRRVLSSTLRRMRT